MSYVATIPVEFTLPAHAVYEALCDLGSHPKWNTGMISISHTGPMQKGLQYVTKSNVLGRVNMAEVEVLEMIPDQAIVLESKTGLIAFRAAFELKNLGPKRCSVICNLRFEFSTLIIDLARSAIESMAEHRIRGDLETLRSLLENKPLPKQG